MKNVIKLTFRTHCSVQTTDHISLLIINDREQEHDC